MQPVLTDWFVDTGASTHMTPFASKFNTDAPYSGNAFFLFGNGHDESISHVVNSCIYPNISL